MLAINDRPILDFISKKFDKIDQYKQIRESGEPDNELTVALRHDDVDKFQSIISSLGLNVDAQNYIRFIYSESKYLYLDINKAIHYFTLAANQNHAVVQCSFGIIYSSNEYFSQDINEYFSQEIIS